MKRVLPLAVLVASLAPACTTLKHYPAAGVRAVAPAMGTLDESGIARLSGLIERRGLRPLGLFTMMRFRKLAEDRAAA